MKSRLATILVTGLLALLTLHTIAGVLPNRAHWKLNVSASKEASSEQIICIAEVVDTDTNEVILEPKMSTKRSVKAEVVSGTTDGIEYRFSFTPSKDGLSGEYHFRVSNGMVVINEQSGLIAIK